MLPKFITNTGLTMFNNENILISFAMQEYRNDKLCRTCRACFLACLNLRSVGCIHRVCNANGVNAKPGTPWHPTDCETTVWYSSVDTTKRESTPPYSVLLQLLFT